MSNKLNRATSIGGPKATFTGERGMTTVFYDDTDSESSEEQEEEKEKIVDYILMPDK